MVGRGVDGEAGSLTHIKATVFRPYLREGLGEVVVVCDVGFMERAA